VLVTLQRRWTVVGSINVGATTGGIAGVAHCDGYSASVFMAIASMRQAHWGEDRKVRQDRICNIENTTY